MPRLELKHHLAAQQLIRRYLQRSAQRQGAFLQPFDVLFPAIDVLHMNAVYMAERGDAGAEHVGAAPETVTVYELGLGRVAHHGVSARNRVASLRHSSKA